MRQAFPLQRQPGGARHQILNGLPSNAGQHIALDLDDGVKMNDLKLQDVLAPIPGLAAKEE
jgi:hypothetical protein